MKRASIKWDSRGSGLLFQLSISNKVQKQLLVKRQLDNKDKVKKLSKTEKEEQKAKEMKKQKSIDYGWDTV